jgi:uncharacterized protein YdeI (YjbR/CyaY-like superfamily)
MKTHDKETEIWLVLPKKSSGKQRIPYAETVEEALCFGWIDSTVKKHDEHHTVQRFTPRRKGSGHSQPNKERLRVMAQQGKIIDAVLEKVQTIIDARAHPFFRFNGNIFLINYLPLREYLESSASLLWV